MGESGENSNVWFKDAIALMEKNNIGWCWWPLKKLGFNNPLEIQVNPGYQLLLDYWSGSGDKPGQAEAFQALMQLAENTKIENCIVHYDVIDAMIRQPQSQQAIPFKINRLENELMIQAADYDLGTDGIAYHDTVSANYHISTGKERQSWNLGRTYRNDGVDIFRDNDGLIYVGDLQAEEWLKYTINVKEAGDYKLSLKVSSESDSGLISVNVNQLETSSFKILENSQGWNWTPPQQVKLNSGINTIKLQIEQGGFNLESLKISK